MTPKRRKRQKAWQAKDEMGGLRFTSFGTFFSTFKISFNHGQFTGDLRNLRRARIFDRDEKRFELESERNSSMNTKTKLVTLVSAKLKEINNSLLGHIAFTFTAHTSDHKDKLWNLLRLLFFVDSLQMEKHLFRDSHMLCVRDAEIKLKTSTLWEWITAK